MATPPSSAPVRTPPGQRWKHHDRQGGKTSVLGQVTGTATGGKGGNSGDAGNATSDNNAVSGTSGNSGDSGSTGGNTAVTSTRGPSSRAATTVAGTRRRATDVEHHGHLGRLRYHRRDRCTGDAGNTSSTTGGNSGWAGNGGDATVIATGWNTVAHTPHTV